MKLYTFLKISLVCGFSTLGICSYFARDYIAPKAIVSTPNVVATVKPAIVSPKTIVTAPKATKTSKLIVPVGCAMAIDDSFTQAEINDFCSPKPTADQIAIEDRKMIDAHIAILKDMGR
jgi:hypothetical protein